MEYPELEEILSQDFVFCPPIDLGSFLVDPADSAIPVEKYQTILGILKDTPEFFLLLP